MPNPSPNPYFYDGVFTDGSKVIINSTFEQALVGNVTPVTATNPTSATNLMTATLQAGTLSGVGESLEIFGAGAVNLTTTTSAVTIAVILGGVTIATFTTGAFAVGAINLGWNLTITTTVISVGVGGTVTLETHGTLNAALTTAAGSVTAYNDSNFAASSSINFGLPVLLQFQATLAAGNAASFVSQRQLLVEVLN